MVGYPGALPLQVLAFSTSLHRLLLLGYLQTPPPPTLLSPLCSLERNQGDGLIKSHSQPAKPPPCSPGKCSLWTHGQCWNMAVGPGWGKPVLGRELCLARGVRTRGWLPCLSCWRDLSCAYITANNPVWVYLPKVHVGKWGWDV